MKFEGKVFRLGGSSVIVIPSFFINQRLLKVGETYLFSVEVDNDGQKKVIRKRN